MHLQNYRSMPHVFLMFEMHPSTKTCYTEMIRFVKEVTSGKDIDTRMEIVNGKGEIETTVDLTNYPIDVSKTQVIQLRSLGLTVAR